MKEMNVAGNGKMDQKLATSTGRRANPTIGKIEKKIVSHFNLLADEAINPVSCNLFHFARKF